MMSNIPKMGHLPTPDSYSYMFIFGWLAIDMELQRSLLRTLCCFQFPWNLQYIPHISKVVMNPWNHAFKSITGPVASPSALAPHLNATIFQITGLPLGPWFPNCLSQKKTLRSKDPFFCDGIHAWFTVEQANFRKIKWVRQVLHPQRIAGKTIGGFHSSIHWKGHSQDT